MKHTNSYLCTQFVLNMKRLALFFLLLIALIPLSAQNPSEEVVRTSIISRITYRNDSTDGHVVLRQDPRLEELIYKKKERDAKNAVYTTVMGYRVQVFSSNEQRTAKSEAYRIDALIKEKFPHLNSYVTYISPFWKVRIGDCISQSEAAQIKNELSKEMPELQQEMYIVREKVLIPE